MTDSPKEEQHEAEEGGSPPRETLHRKKKGGGGKLSKRGSEGWLRPFYIVFCPKKAPTDRRYAIKNGGGEIKREDLRVLRTPMGGK